ncbi:MAG: hypothetical protein MI976_03810 [Pseudomonadales bacterium]|nr:hypothetical protein [Pseudomonadales bacterium]
MGKPNTAGLAAVVCLCSGCLVSGAAVAAQWSQNEIHFQHGDLLYPFAPDDQDKTTTIITFQHASGWEYGGNFFFIDHISTDDGNTAFYGEWYPTLSSKKIFDVQYGDGLLQDINLVLGFNAGPDANVLKYLPGFQLDWNLPGFAYFKTLITGYIDQNEGAASGPDAAPKEDDSYMLDIAWLYPIKVGEQAFSITGHAEYITSRDNEFGETRRWILAQPQFRWDLGKAWYGTAGQLQIGIEYQYWKNKLGSDETENVAQLLVVWGL